MKDYIVRFLIAGILGVCVSLLIIGGSQAKASEIYYDTEWVLPTEGVITDVFGTRGGSHKGIDIAGELGVPVRAVKDGIVTKSYLSASYGNVILIKHKDGFESVYAHLEKRMAKEGEHVKKAEKIGTMGNTGYSTGVHLHFELHEKEWTFQKENAVNPESLLGKIEVGQNMAAIPVTKPKSIIEAGGKPHNAGNGIHIVSSGETLWGIAQKNGLSVKQLIDLNELEDTIIRPGQKLEISWGAETATNVMRISSTNE
ncbi:hypothetical protein AM500_10015 [Bacillus sp. FJAT-18017]|uniref:peptidoglycan DD-metalloendopeptidase family protein n=1 Tax=Bacillus sp. FJAT-18017 TaxID=1705566 RepID=UPI0006BCFA1B|nr:peptidoglycan DD-metalloendopeptidase family protein [Bacillus sp. FJAT-18017]ALC90080.1 hypothetical protein AM500_10015 [Bacillus sp. FJAT-18017]